MIYKLEFRMPTGGFANFNTQSLSVNLVTIKSIPKYRLDEPLTLKFEGSMGFTWIAANLYYTDKPTAGEIDTRTKQFKLMIIAWLADLNKITSNVEVFDHTKECVE